LTREAPPPVVALFGPTGVGKTTTFYAMIDRINRQQRSKIVTIEDPVEYLHEHKRSMVVQQEVGKDAKDYHSALMHVLRLDPDVIGIGEMRDAPTIAAGLLAAETGHLVIATLHTTTAAQTVERLVTAVPPEQKAGVAIQLANVLRGVVTQALLPTVDRKSRVLACEVMLASAAVRNNIRECRLPQLHDAIMAGGGEGMKAMDLRLRELYQEGVITYETALTYAKEPRMLLDHARAARPAAAVLA
jgi:twitching motility protein PilT